MNVCIGTVIITSKLVKTALFTDTITVYVKQQSEGQYRFEDT